LKIEANTTKTSKTSVKPAAAIPIVVAVMIAGWAIYTFASAPPKQPTPGTSTTTTGSDAGSPAASFAKRLRKSREAIHAAALVSMQGTKDFERGGFSVSYPASWQTSDEKIADAHIFRAHALDGLANMTVTTSKMKVADFDWWKDTVIESLKRVMGPNAKVLSVKPVKIRGASKASQIVYETQLEDSPVRARQSMVLAVRNDRGYTIACSAPALYYNEFAKVFQTIESSIQVNDPTDNPRSDR
jgi:hypothetical protein